MPRMVIIVAALAWSLAAHAQTPQPPTPQPAPAVLATTLDYAQIKNAASGLCISGTALAACDVKSNAQRTLVRTTAEGVVTIGEDAKCLTDAGDGQPVAQAPCDAPAAQWSDAINANGTLTWTNRQTGRCLNNQGMPSTPIIVRPCSGAQWQQWGYALVGGPPPAPPACWPAVLGGSGVGLDYRQVAQPHPIAGQPPLVGWALWWHCRDAFAVTQTPRFFCNDADLYGSCITGALRAALRAVSPAPLVAAWGDVVQSSAEGSYVQWINLATRAEIAQAAKLKTPQWAVAKNATSITRPAYPITAGVRGKTSTARALVAATCDCSVRAVEGSSVYCAHESTKATVALCKSVSAP